MRIVHISKKMVKMINNKCMKKNDGDFKYMAVLVLREHNKLSYNRAAELSYSSVTQRMINCLLRKTTKSYILGYICLYIKNYLIPNQRSRTAGVAVFLHINRYSRQIKQQLYNNTFALLRPK